jgi:hypothetical protein
MMIWVLGSSGKSMVLPLGPAICTVIPGAANALFGIIDLICFLIIIFGATYAKRDGIAIQEMAITSGSNAIQA